MSSEVPLPFPASLCHRCAALKLVKGAPSVFLMCTALPDKCPRQPVLQFEAVQAALPLDEEQATRTRQYELRDVPPRFGAILVFELHAHRVGEHGQLGRLHREPHHLSGGGVDHRHSFEYLAGLVTPGLEGDEEL